MSDRDTFPPAIPGFQTSLSAEPQIHVLDLLKQVGHVPRLDLFLYTRGGSTDSVWPFVNALRDHTDHLSILVPWRAHSSGTLICLGADEVVMPDGAELSPIDPTTGNQFNPRDPTNPQLQFGVSVEDVTSYFELARDRAGIKDEAHTLEVFKALTASVHPLALGNVQRVYGQIRRIGRRLLALHMPIANQEKLDGIVKGLTTDFFSHLHAISRDEAIELMGDWVRKPTDAENSAMTALFESYLGTFGLRTKFNLPYYMGDQVTRDLQALGAILESTAASFVHTTDIKVMQRPQLPQGVQVQVPPGQLLPLAPWVGRQYDYGVTRIGWFPNQEGT